MIEKMSFESYADFVVMVESSFDVVTSDFWGNGCNVYVIAKYHEAKKILPLLFACGHEPASIYDFSFPDDNGYDAEYVITISGYYKDGEIWVEPMRNSDGGYLDCIDSGFTFVMDNCNSKVLKHVNTKDYCYEVSVEDDEIESDCECEHCCCDNSCASNDNPSISEHKRSDVSATYKVNGKYVTKEEYESFVTRIEDNYLDNMKQMLIAYSDAMDEINEWRKFFYL